MFTYTLDGWRGYALGVILVAAATIARAPFSVVDQHIVPFATYFPAVLLVSLVGGWRPGTLTLALSALLGFWAFTPADPAANWNVVIFVVSSALIVWLADNYRRVVRSLQEADEQRRLLVQEMSHRNRNISAVADAIIRNSLKHDPASAERLMGRLRTLLNADRVFADKDALGERFSDIVRESLRPFDEDRASVEGEDVVIDSKSARSWALIIHELATNAAKYGALAKEEGALHVVWSVNNDEILLQWTESGHGGAAQAPPAAGFGTKLIDVSARGLGGEVHREMDESGLRCIIRAPLRRVEQPTA